MSLFKSFIYAMFSDYKRLSISQIANNTAINYQKLQYFFSESNWDIKELNDIRRHWIMSFLAWTLTYWIKQNGCLSKILNEPPQTIGQCKQAVASLIIIDSAFLLSKNKEFAASLYKIKSERFKKRLKN